MKLYVHEVSAIVATLEKEHNEKYGKVGEDGITAKERAMLIAKNKRIRAELRALSKETRIELQVTNDGCWFNPTHQEKGALQSEAATLETLIDAYEFDKPAKKLDKNAIFDREDMKRRVIRAAIDSKDVDEILKKLSPKQKTVKKVAVKKAAKKAAKKKK